MSSMCDDEAARLRAEVDRLLAEVARLRAELDRANDPTWPARERPRNALETISHWWCPDKSRHMRQAY